MKIFMSIVYFSIQISVDILVFKNFYLFLQQSPNGSLITLWNGDNNNDNRNNNNNNNDNTNNNYNHSVKSKQLDSVCNYKFVLYR